MMKPNRQSSVRSLRGKKGVSSSSGAEYIDPEREVGGGEHTGRLSPSNNAGPGSNSKVIHKGFFNSFQG